jgi:hypothetical protein
MTLGDKSFVCATTLPRSAGMSALCDSCDGDDAGDFAKRVGRYLVAKSHTHRCNQDTFDHAVAWWYVFKNRPDVQCNTIRYKYRLGLLDVVSKV